MATAVMTVTTDAEDDAIFALTGEDTFTFTNRIMRHQIDNAVAQSKPSLDKVYAVADAKDKAELDAVRDKYAGTVANPILDTPNL